MAEDKAQYKILFIEDNENDKIIIEDYLSQIKHVQYDLIWMTKIQEALEHPLGHTADVILMDLSLPDNIELEGMLKLKKQYPTIPIVVLTGNDNDLLSTRSISLGVQDYLIKNSIDADKLKRTMHYSIERNRIKLELDQANATLHDMVGKDPLTGLLNRRGLKEKLTDILAEKKRINIGFYALLLDIDDFKKINDQYGHGIGDAALVFVANAIRNTLRETDYISRVGGDEFIVILTNTRQAEAMIVAQKIRVAIAQINVVISGTKTVNLTASIGMMALEEAMNTIDELSQHLHISLKRSKLGGKNQVSMSDSNQETINTQDNIISLQDAMKDESKFYAVVHALVNLENNEIIGYELLSRFSFPEFQSPDDFFSFARSNDLITVVDRLCFKTCAKEAANIPDGMQIHVNIFPSTLLEYKVEELVLDFPSNATSSKYCLELSEQQIIGDPSYLTKPTQDLKDKGFLIAVDDIGFGHSSLESLVILEPHIIKIDRSYITGISDKKDKQAHLKRILKIANSCDAEVIAEGIETIEDLTMVKELGVSFGQGFYFGKPGKLETS